MADTQTDGLDLTNPDVVQQYMIAVTDPKKWAKLVTGDEGSGLMDLLVPHSPDADRHRRSEELRLGLHKNLLEYAMTQARQPSQAEAAQRFGLPPSVAPETMMPGPRVTTPGNLEEVIGGNHPAIGEPQVRPGLQPDGIPQQVGPFGLPQPYQPGALSTTPLTPQYQFPTNEPGPMVPNMQARLRPIDQGIIAAQTHAMSLRGPTPHAQGDYPYRDNIAKLEAAAIAENDGKPLSARQVADIAETVHKTFNPIERPGSANARKLGAEADTAVTESEKRAKVLDATIAEKTAQATWQTQQALDAAGMFQAKLKHLVSQTNLNDVNAGRVGQTVFNQQAVIELQRASKTLDGIKAAWAMGNVDEQGLMALMKSYLETTQKQLQLQGVPPNAISELLGFPPSQMTTVPGIGVPPPISGVTGSITPSVAPPSTPQAAKPPTINRAEEELKALEKSNPGYEYQRKPDGTLQRRKKS